MLSASAALASAPARRNQPIGVDPSRIRRFRNLQCLPISLGQAGHIVRNDPCFGAGFLSGGFRQWSNALGGVAGVARRCEIGRIIAVTGNDVIDGIGLTGREWHGGCSVSVRPKGAAPN